MDTPIAQLVITDLCDRLKKIDGTDGVFAYDIGDRVFRGRIHIDEDEVPAISILEGEDPVEATVNPPLLREQADLTIRGTVAADPLNPFDAGHGLLADMKRALFTAAADGQEIERLSTSKATMIYTGRDIAQREEGQRHCIVDVFIRVTHSEKYGDPYARN